MIIKDIRSKRSENKTVNYRFYFNKAYREEVLDLKLRQGCLLMHRKVQSGNTLHTPKNIAKMSQLLSDTTFYAYDLERTIVADRLRHKKALEQSQFTYSNMCLFTDKLFEKYNIPDEEWENLIA